MAMQGTATALLCGFVFPQWISGPCSLAPGQQNILSPDHQGPKDITHTGYHYFDAHRLQPLLLQAPALQIHLRASPLTGPEGASETVEDPSSDEERATTDGESEVEAEVEEADLPLKNHGAANSGRT